MAPIHGDVYAQPEPRAPQWRAALGIEVGLTVLSLNVTLPRGRRPRSIWCEQPAACDCYDCREEALAAARRAR